MLVDHLHVLHRVQPRGPNALGIFLCLKGVSGYAYNAFAAGQEAGGMARTGLTGDISALNIPEVESSARAVYKVACNVIGCGVDTQYTHV